LKPTQTLSYGGWVDTLDVAPTPNGVRSNWEFTSRIPLVFWWNPTLSMISKEDNEMSLQD